MAKFVFSAFADEAGSSLEEQIAALKENGIHYIEPRNIGGKSVMDLTDDEVKAVKAELDKNGIKVGSLGSPIGKYPITDDFDSYIAKVKRAIEIAKMLDTKNIRMFSFFVKQNELAQYKDEVIRRLRIMVELAEAEGVTLCHENESAIYGQMPAEVKEILTEVKGLGGIFDAANYRMNNGDTMQGIEATLINFKYMHIKDAIYKEQTIVPAGEGEGKIGDIIDIVNDKVDGLVYLTLEPHLHKFLAYKSIDTHELKGKYCFQNGREAFDFAVKALEKLLAQHGYTKDENGVYERNMKKVRFGIVGGGNMGTGHSKNFLANKIHNGVLTAICDINPKKFEFFREKFGDSIKYFENAEDMFKSGEVDVVIICTPHYFHPDLAILALDNNINCIVEKPAGVYTLQVKEMIKRAEKSDKILGIMFNQRTNPAFKKMREMVQSGAIGEIKRTNWIITDWYRTQQYYDSGDWRATWKGEGGGVLYNQAPHQLDLFQWIVGMMPTKVHAFCHYGKWHDIEVEDDVTCYVEYPNGATGVFITTTADTPGTNRFEITGTKGTLIFENNKVIFKKLKIDEREHCVTATGGFEHAPKEDPVELTLVGENSQHVGICNNIANAILGIEDVYAPASDGLHGVHLANAMHLSSWLDRAVTLPIDDELFYEELKKRIAVSKPHAVREKVEAQG